MYEKGLVLISDGLYKFRVEVSIWNLVLFFCNEYVIKMKINIMKINVMKMCYGCVVWLRNVGWDF